MDEEQQRAIAQMMAHAKIGANGAQIATILTLTMLQSEPLSIERRERIAELLHSTAEQWRTIGDARHLADVEAVLRVLEPPLEPPRPDRNR